MRGVLLVLAGCGRIAFAPHSDGAAGDAMSPDAPPDGPCVWSAFSAPAPLPGPIQSPSDDWCPTPTVDGLQLFFHSYRGSAMGQLYFATRATTSDAFGAASNVTELTTGTSQQFNPTLTGDGLHIIYADSGVGGFDLFEAVRTSATGQFGAAVELTSLNSSTGTDWGAFVSSDGLRLMYTSNRGAGFDQIYESSRNAVSDPFAPPTLHGELSVAGTNQWTPTLTADWLDMYFASNRSGGPGGYDIYFAHRAALGQAFGPATLVPELSTAMDDLCTRLTPDGATMYFNYSAVVSGGNTDLDATMRTCN